MLNLDEFIETANNKCEEGRLTSSHYGLYDLGYTCATMVDTMRSKVHVVLNLKICRSSDHSLK